MVFGKILILMKKELYIAKLALISLYFSDKFNSMAVPKLRLKTSLIIRLPLSNKDFLLNQT